MSEQSPIDGMPSWTTVACSIEDGVAQVRLDQPAKLNALSLKMRKEVGDCFAWLHSQPGVRAVVLCGAGRAFCSGADLGDKETDGLSGLALARAKMTYIHRMIRAIKAMPVPVIAAVQGSAVGIGWSMALACDMIFAAEDAKFAQVFKKIGLAPDGGATLFLIQRVGMARAKELVLSARFVQAPEALSLGLVERMLPTDGLLAAAMEEAKSLASGPTLALGMTKALMEASVSPSLDDVLAQELLIQPQLLSSEDFKEGVAAFSEKRAPQFKGR